MKGDKVNAENLENIYEILDYFKIQEEEKTIDVMRDDEYDLTRQIKKIIWNDLNESDRRILLLYAEYKSQRKLGDRLGVSVATVNNVLKRIKNNIKNKLRKKGLHVPNC